MENREPPQYPAGEFTAVAGYDQDVRAAAIRDIRDAPERLRVAVKDLSLAQLDTRYRNWTARQITHHLADSHLHSLIRFKWALTEEEPRIKAYEEADWVELPDSKRGEIEPAVALLVGLHAKWVQLLELMTAEQYERRFVHPQTNESIRLWTALCYYAWHGRHHTAQILWLRQRHGW